MGQYVATAFNSGTSPVFPGWQWRGNNFPGNNLSTGGACAAGTKCTLTLSGITTNSTRSAWVIVAATTNNVTISRVCTNDTTCASGNDNWALCAASGCHENNGSLGIPNEDMAYNTNGTVSSSSFTVILSGASGTFFFVNLIEYVPPSGFIPVIDGFAVATSASCSTCTMAAPTVSGTDAIYHNQLAGGTVSAANAPSSPYFQDFNGGTTGLNITSGTAPTFAQSSSAFMDSAISFKTTVAFTADSKNSLYSLVNMATPGFSGATCDSTTGCTVTIPSTGAGHLLFMATDNASGKTIGSVTDNKSNTWTVPTGANTCAVALTGIPNDTLSCAYLLSSSSATTSVTMKANSGSTSFGILIYEISRTSGSFVLDSQNSQQNASSGVYNGISPSISGASDVIFHSFICPGGCNSITYYPLSDNNLNGGNGPNPEQNFLSAAVLNTTNTTAPISGGNVQATVVTYIAFK